MLLSLFAASIGSQTFFAIGLTERLSEQLRSDYLARGAVQYALLSLERDATATVDGLSEAWADNPGVFQHHALGGGTFGIVAREEAGVPPRYGLVDEERRISLNAAPAEVLQRLFEIAGGLREDEAEQLAAAVEDWRDEDDKERPQGAEGIYYRSLSDAYDCKNGPFENAEELLLLRGVTPKLYRRLEPYLTVYGSGLLNLNTTSRTALQALGLSPIGVEGLIAFRSGEDGAEGTPDDRQLVSIEGLESQLRAFVPVEDLARLSRFAKAGIFGVGSSDFRTFIQADTGRPASRVQVSCVLSREGEIKLWSER